MKMLRLSEKGKDLRKVPQLLVMLRLTPGPAASKAMLQPPEHGEVERAFAWELRDWLLDPELN